MDLPNCHISTQISVLNTSFEGNDYLLIGYVRDHVTLVIESMDEISKGFIVALVQLVEVVLRFWALECALEIGYELSQFCP